VVAFGLSLLALVLLAWGSTALIGISACFFGLSFCLDRDNTLASFAFRPKEAVLLPDSGEKIASGQATYHMALAADLMVLMRNAGGQNRPLRFWYDGDEPHLDLFHSLYSLYLWGYQDLSKELPAMPMDDIRNLLPTQGRILHLTSNPDRITTHRKLLESRGIGWREVGIWNLGQRGQRYTVALDEIILP